MDIAALQRELRAFAAARDWQPFHTPKNLAMALMVEAAELLELFQWKTLAESRALTRNAQDKERVADEIADVLLYLLQLADHTDVDIEEAVERKLRKNAVKHPAKHPTLEPVAQVPTPVSAKVHLLVDWENVQPMGEALKQLVPQSTDVWLFHGPHQKVDDASHRRVYGNGVTLVPRSGSGKNALDFQLTYYVGYIAARQSGATFVIVSNDQGYDPMLEHARELGFDARRCEFRKAVPQDRQIKNQGPGAGLARNGSLKPVLKTPKPTLSKEKASTNVVVTQIPHRLKATRQDVQRLAHLLQTMEIEERPERRDDLMGWLQTHLGEIGMVSLRVTHALAQLQAQKRVVLKGDKVSYLAMLAPQPAAAVRKKATTTPALPSKKKAVAPTAAQVAQAVLASLKKMPKNKPTHRSGLLKFIETHASQAADPKAMAQQVCALLEARKDVTLSSDGRSAAYPKLQTKNAASA